MKISIFGGYEEDDTTPELSKNDPTLPSASLCEEDVVDSSRHPPFKFLSTHVFGHNERLRFMMLQKQSLSRWGPLVMTYNFLDSVSSLYNVHNILSALLILISMLWMKTINTLYATMTFSIAWFLISMFTFDRDILPSFFYFGYTTAESTQQVDNKTCGKNVI